MGSRKRGTLPKPWLDKRGHQRLRIGGREFVLSKPGIREATERYNARLAAWVENGETSPEGFTLEPKLNPNLFRKNYWNRSTDPPTL